MYDYKLCLALGILIFFCWIFFIFRKAFLPEKKKNGSTHFIIIINNQEWAVEEIMRNMSGLKKRIRDNIHITVIDFNSQDKTGEILEKLKKEKEREFSVIRLNKEKTKN